MQSTLNVILPTLLLLSSILTRPLCHGICSIFCLGIVLSVALVIRLNRLSLIALMSLLLIQAQWGITQFIVQQDLGFNLVGESPLSADTVGVAKFSVGSQKVMRAYGPYSHANVFGGMMLVGALLTVSFLPSRVRTYFLIIFGIAIIVSFSRSAYLGALLIPLFAGMSRIPRLKTIGLVLLLLSPLIFFRLVDQNQSWEERVRGYEWAHAIIIKQGIVNGVGFGRYEEALQGFLAATKTPFASWEIAPVHSMPLLLAVEIGLLPALLLMGAILGTRSRKTLLLLVPLLPALLFDHYFLTNLPALYTLLVLLFSVY